MQFQYFYANSDVAIVGQQWETALGIKRLKPVSLEGALRSSLHLQASV